MEYAEGIWGESEEGPGPCFHFHATGLQQVRNWIRKQRFVPCDLSDEFLQRFLDVTCEDIHAATKMIHRYFYLRQEPGPIFRDRNPASPTNRNLFGLLYAVPLRNVLNDGEIILLTGLLEPTVKYSILGHLKLIALTIDYLLWDKMNKFTDLKILMNGQNFLCPALLENSFAHIEPYAKKFQKSLPIKLQGFYIYRPPNHVKEITRIYNGLWFTTIETPEEAALKFPATILPFELGGSLGSLRELLDTWNLQMKQRTRFLVEFERRMTNDYRRRMCHEREVREGGKNWVWNLKLVAEESEYKQRYYERMANQKPLEHPAFGKQRQKNRPKVERPYDPLRKIRMLAEEESQEMFPHAEERRRTRGGASEILFEQGQKEKNQLEFALLPFLMDD